MILVLGVYGGAIGGLGAVSTLTGTDTGSHPVALAVLGSLIFVGGLYATAYAATSIVRRVYRHFATRGDDAFRRGPGSHS